MHELVFFSLMVLAVLRIFGAAISLDYYFDNRDSRLIIMALGWIIAVFAVIPPILADFVGPGIQSELLYIANIILISIGYFTILIGIFSYFMKVPLVWFAVPLAFFTVSPLLIYLVLGSLLAINISSLLATLTGTIVALYPLLKHQAMRTHPRTVMRWYYGILVVYAIYFVLALSVFTQSSTYGLYTSVNPILISINYLFAVGMTLASIIFIGRFEYSISSAQKDKLKDEYSHKLGNLLQAIAGLLFLLVDKQGLSDNQVKDFGIQVEDQLEEASKLLREIRRL
jgi:hypothetical protein